MIIPAIDFAHGKVVQLVQGERLALERELEPVLAAMRGFAWLQVIDLDAAKGEGDNRELVRRCCQAGYRIRVGGGLRSLERAREALAWGAERVILSSALFRDGQPDAELLNALQPLGRRRLVFAVDARAGQVAVRGWRERLPLTPVQAIAGLEPYCGEFLYTHVDTEGLMQGMPLEPIRAVRAATRRPLTVAGGIANLELLRELDELGCHSVLGMAFYTGLFDRHALLAFNAAAKTRFEEEAAETFRS